MRIEPRVPSKHNVSVLDLTVLKNRAIDLLKKNNLFPDNAILKHSFDWGIVESKGKHYLINTEGVGSMSALEDDRSQISWYKSYLNEEGKEGSFDMYPCVTSSIDYRDTLELPVREVISLDKFIRFYNFRLEENFDGWEYFFNKGE